MKAKPNTTCKICGKDYLKDIGYLHKLPDICLSCSICVWKESMNRKVEK